MTDAMTNEHETIVQIGDEDGSNIDTHIGKSKSKMQQAWSTYKQLMCSRKAKAFCARPSNLLKKKDFSMRDEEGGQLTTWACAHEPQKVILTSTRKSLKYAMVSLIMKP